MVSLHLSSSPAGARQWGRVHRGCSPAGRGPPPPGAAHAWCPAHLLGPTLEPHRVDEVIASAQPPLSNVQLQAEAAAGARFCRRFHPARVAQHPLSADVMPCVFSYFLLLRREKEFISCLACKRQHVTTSLVYKYFPFSHTWILGETVETARV